MAVLASAMGLSENLAGVTLLAFGNGSPDVFTALSDWNGDTELLYAELFGFYPIKIKLKLDNFFIFLFLQVLQYLLLALLGQLL